MLLAKIINFYRRIVRDRDFRHLLENAASSEECIKQMREQGYDFTPEELETGTLKILENNGLKDLDDGFSELSDREIELAFGGFWSNWRKRRPIYKYPPTKEPPGSEPPIVVQPMYGVVVEPIEIEPPEAIAMYGIVVSELDQWEQSK